MTTHYIDPTVTETECSCTRNEELKLGAREPTRDCVLCNGTGVLVTRACSGCDDCCECEIPEGFDYCPMHGYLGRCSGTGRVPHEGKPEIEVWLHLGPLRSGEDPGWVWKDARGSALSDSHGPYDTAEAATEAARAALREET